MKGVRRDGEPYQNHDRCRLALDNLLVSRSILQRFSDSVSLSRLGHAPPVGCDIFMDYLGEEKT